MFNHIGFFFSVTFLLEFFMGQIYLETYVKSTIERCFDLSRSADLHIKSALQNSRKLYEEIFDSEKSDIRKISHIAYFTIEYNLFPAHFVIGA